MLWIFKKGLNTHIFQFNVPPLIILEWLQDIVKLTSKKNTKQWWFIYIFKNNISRKDQSQQYVSMLSNGATTSTHSYYQLIRSSEYFQSNCFLLNTQKWHLWKTQFMQQSNIQIHLIYCHNCEATTANIWHCLKNWWLNLLNILWHPCPVCWTQSSIQMFPSKTQIFNRTFFCFF